MAAGTAAAASALSLPGIALSETTGRQIENEQRDFKNGSPLAALDKIPQAYLNPQLDEKEYRGHTKELKLLFSPLQIGKSLSVTAWSRPRQVPPAGSPV